MKKIVKIVNYADLALDLRFYHQGKWYIKKTPHYAISCITGERPMHMRGLEVVAADYEASSKMNFDRLM